MTPLAQWQSGYAADCKSVYVGSIPACASSRIKALSNEGLFLLVRHVGTIGRQNGGQNLPFNRRHTGPEPGPPLPDPPGIHGEPPQADAPSARAKVLSRTLSRNNFHALPANGFEHGRFDRSVGNQPLHLLPSAHPEAGVRLKLGVV